MKSQNILHRHLAFVAFVATFALLPASAQAQEITNTEFDPGPNVTTISQPNPQSTSAANSAAPAENQQAGLVGGHSTPTESSVTASVLVCVGLIALYALLEAKRANRTLNSIRRSRNI
jgi:type IV secretory pathway TrbL component